MADHDMALGTLDACVVREKALCCHALPSGEPPSSAVQRQICSPSTSPYMQFSNTTRFSQLAIIAYDLLADAAVPSQLLFRRRPHMGTALHRRHGVVRSS